MMIALTICATVVALGILAGLVVLGAYALQHRPAAEPQPNPDPPGRTRAIREALDAPAPPDADGASEVSGGGLTYDERGRLIGWHRHRPRPTPSQTQRPAPQTPTPTQTITVSGGGADADAAAAAVSVVDLTTAIAATVREILREEALPLAPQPRPNEPAPQPAPGPTRIPVSRVSRVSDRKETPTQSRSQPQHPGPDPDEVRVNRLLLPARGRSTSDALWHIWWMRAVPREIRQQVEGDLLEEVRKGAEEYASALDENPEDEPQARKAWEEFLREKLADFLK